MVEVTVRVRIEQGLWRERLIQLFRQQTDVAARIATPWREGIDGFERLAESDAVERGATAVIDGAVGAMRRLDDERVEDVSFAVFEVVQRVVARRAGAMRVPAAELQFAFAKRFVEDLLGERVPEGREDLVLRSAACEVEVVELPANGRPAAFSGLVGAVRAKAGIDGSPSLRVGDSFVLRLDVEGDADLRVFRAPTLTGLAGFVVRGVREERGAGSVAAVYELVAGRAGENVVPRIEVGFFATASGRYEVAATEPIEVVVGAATDGTTELPGLGAAGGATSGARGAAELGGEPESTTPVPVPGIDVPFGVQVVPRSDRPEAVPDFAPRPRLSTVEIVSWCVLPWFVLASAAWFRRRATSRPERLRRLRQRKAFFALRAEFAKADADRRRAFVAFLASQLDRAEASVVGPRLVERLTECGVARELALRVDAALEALAAERFGGGRSPLRDDEVLELAQAVAVGVSEFERSIRGRRASRSVALASIAMILGSLATGSLEAQEGAAGTRDLPTEARRWLESGDAARAFAAYQEALEAGQHEASVLCFDLALCAEKLGRAAEAVLWYERALVVEPTYLEARANLRLLRQQLGFVDREPGALLRVVAEGMLEGVEALGPRFALCVGAVVQLVALHWIWVRRRWSAGGVLLLFGVLVVGFGARVALRGAGERAVVVLAGTRVVAEPHERASAVGSMAAGQVVEVMEGSRRWVRVREGEVVGWVEAGALAPIRSSPRD